MNGRGPDQAPSGGAAAPGPMGRVIRFCLGNPLLVAVAVAVAVAWGVLVAPFDWDLPGLERYPVAADAIPETPGPGDATPRSSRAPDRAAWA